MAVWIARYFNPRSAADGEDGQDVGYAWFQVNRGEFSLKDVGYLPERRSGEAYAALIEAGLDWLRQKGATGCRYTGAEGDQVLEQGLQM